MPAIQSISLLCNGSYSACMAQSIFGAKSDRLLSSCCDTSIQINHWLSTAFVQTKRRVWMYVFIYVFFFFCSFYFVSTQHSVYNAYVIDTFENTNRLSYALKEENKNNFNDFFQFILFFPIKRCYPDYLTKCNQYSFLAFIYK